MTDSRLSYLRPSDRRTRRHVWAWYRCSCGNEVEATTTAVKHDQTKSCGCLRKETCRQNGKSTALPKGEAGLRLLWRRYRQSAKERDLEWTLGLPEFRYLTKLPCFYCGAEPAQVCMETEHGAYTYSGLDRRDPSSGYVTGNCFPCCGKCNYAKHEMTKDEFMAHVERIAAHQRLA